MNTSSRLIILIVTLLLCQCLTEIECRRTTSSSRRGSNNRRNNYGNPGQGSNSGRQGGFLSFFGSNKKPTSTGSSGSTTNTKSGSGWITASQSQPAKPSGQSNPAWGNPYYKPSAPKPGTGTYGWSQSNTNTNTFQKSGQTSSNIGPGYPLQNGFPQASSAGRVPQQTHGLQPATQTHGSQSATPTHAFQTHASNPVQPSHAYNTAQHSSSYNPAPQPHGYPQQTHGYNAPPQTHGYNAPQQTHGYNAPQQTHGYNAPPQTHGYNVPPQSHGYNSPPQSHGYSPNAGYHPPPSYSQPSYTGHNYGGYHPSSNYGHQGFASSHGFSPSYYPSQNSFGYPGQGLLGGSHSPKFGGLSLFGGGSGNFGYGSNSWGVPSYGSKRSSGTGKLLTGLALGAGAGYLTSSLVNKISNPWGYSGYGYGSRFGYDRPLIVKEIRETTKSDDSYRDPGPNTKDELIHCVETDPQTRVTLINPNCSCTVTTGMDPMTNQPVQTHTCTTATGQVLPPIPIGLPPQTQTGEQFQFQPNAVNNPNASPNYGGLYNDNTRYGDSYNMGPVQPAPVNATAVQAPMIEVVQPGTSAPTTTEQEVSSTLKVDSPTTDAMLNDSPGTPAKVKEFYSQLEQIVSMGKFTNEGIR